MQIDAIVISYDNAISIIGVAKCSQFFNTHGEYYTYLIVVSESEKYYVMITRPLNNQAPQVFITSLGYLLTFNGIPFSNQ